MSDTITIDIQAFIDGRDQLIIQGNTLQWDHIDYAAVGRYLGANEPTIITTTLNGVTQLNQTDWYPTWPEKIALGEPISELAADQRCILHSNPERHDGPRIAQNRMPDVGRKLMQVLVGDCKCDRYLRSSESMFATASVVKLWNSST
jgi:hypothetical protein